MNKIELVDKVETVDNDKADELCSMLEDAIVAVQKNLMLTDKDLEGSDSFFSVMKKSDGTPYLVARGELVGVLVNLINSASMINGTNYKEPTAN